MIKYCTIHVLGKAIKVGKFEIANYSQLVRQYQSLLNVSSTVPKGSVWVMVTVRSVLRIFHVPAEPYRKLQDVRTNLTVRESYY